jgi:hypothetical protein
MRYFRVLLALPLLPVLIMFNIERHMVQRIARRQVRL